MINGMPQIIPFITKLINIELISILINIVINIMTNKKNNDNKISLKNRSNLKPKAFLIRK